jgi:hypothetical protein
MLVYFIEGYVITYLLNWWNDVWKGKTEVLVELAPVLLCPLQTPHGLLRK